MRPANASNKEYSFRVEEVEGSEFADVSVKEDGTLIAKSAGSARVVAVSKDGGYTDFSDGDRRFFETLRF